MFVPRLRLPSGHALIVLDLLVVGWVVLFVLLGLLVHGTVEELLVLSNSISTAGQAVDDTGNAIGSIDVPLVGGAIAAVGQQIQTAGQSVIAAAGSAQDSIERLALVTGLLVAVLPSLPLLAYYLPTRLVRALEVRAVKATLVEGAGDPLFERLLAQRAALHLSFRELRRVSKHPWRDLEHGELTPLASAELRRLGVSPRLLTSSAR